MIIFEKAQGTIDFGDNKDNDKTSIKRKGEKSAVVKTITKNIVINKDPSPTAFLYSPLKMFPCKEKLHISATCCLILFYSSMVWFRHFNLNISKNQFVAEVLLFVLSTYYAFLLQFCYSQMSFKSLI